MSLINRKLFVIQLFWSAWAVSLMGYQCRLSLIDDVIKKSGEDQSIRQVIGRDACVKNIFLSQLPVVVKIGINHPQVSKEAPLYQDMVNNDQRLTKAIGQVAKVLENRVSFVCMDSQEDIFWFLDHLARTYREKSSGQECIGADRLPLLVFVRRQGESISLTMAQSMNALQLLQTTGRYFFDTTPKPLSGGVLQTNNHASTLPTSAVRSLLTKQMAAGNNKTIAK